MTTLPFLGKLNTVFIVAVAFGMFLIMVAMVLHIINAVRGKIWKAHGLIRTVRQDLYLSCGRSDSRSLYDGKSASGRNRYGDHVRNPAFAHLFREPLTRMLQKRADKMETGKAMFVVQGFLNSLKHCSVTSLIRFPLSVSERLR